MWETVGVIDASMGTGVDADAGTPSQVADGGRQHRYVDRFRVRLPPGKKTRMVLRVGVDEEMKDLDVSVKGKVIGTVAADDSGVWCETSVDIPAGPPKARPR